MSCVELWHKPNFGRRLRRVACTATAGMKRIAGNFFSSLGVQAWTAPTQAPVTGLPITGDAGGTKTVTVDLQFHGQDIPAGGKTATITYDIGAGDQTATAALADGDTPVAAAGKIVTAISGVTGLAAVKGQGTTITVTPDDGVTLSKISVVVA